ncbi:unnamed protein product [Anisakis simplex]|uniref:RRM domain-containing protein n=1 Tax=Anisakis simplex TaxID=6269 RepID=A0A0M3K131_ANISI|nr:unnamed protein product [Anisakis simplex]
MALPPRFPGMIPAYGSVPLPPMAPLMSFPNPYFMPNPLMAAAVNSQRMAAPTAPQSKPPEKPPVTTVFVGNITDKCSNELIRSILSECGAVATWKRIQGSNGKFQAFGFCEFESPYGTMRALRILHDYQLAERKLVVKIDDKTRTMVKEYVAKQRNEKGLSAEQLSGDEMPADEENAAEDEVTRQKIQTLIETDAPNLLPIEGQGEPVFHSRDISLSNWFIFILIFDLLIGGFCVLFVEIEILVSSICISEGELDEKTHSPGAERSRVS